MMLPLRHSQRELQFKAVLALMLILLGWLLVEYTSLLYRSYQIEQKKQWFIQENERLAHQNQTLAQQYEYYKTDYFFRKEAKRKLNKKEPGEKVIVLAVGEEPAASSNQWEIRPDFPQQWWEYLFGEKAGLTP